MLHLGPLYIYTYGTDTLVIIYAMSSFDESYLRMVYFTDLFTNYLNHNVPWRVGAVTPILTHEICHNIIFPLKNCEKIAEYNHNWSMQFRKWIS